MLKPKVIREVAVLIHDIIVRSYAALVRSKASSVAMSSRCAPWEVCSAICVPQLFALVPSLLSSKWKHSYRSKRGEYYLHAERQLDDGEDGVQYQQRCP
jgi:hypothetical protein